MHGDHGEWEGGYTSRLVVEFEPESAAGPDDSGTGNTGDRKLKTNSKGLGPLNAPPKSGPIRLPAAEVYLDRALGAPVRWRFLIFDQSSSESQKLSQLLSALARGRVKATPKWAQVQAPLPIVIEKRRGKFYLVEGESEEGPIPTRAEAEKKRSQRLSQRHPRMSAPKPLGPASLVVRCSFVQNNNFLFVETVATSVAEEEQQNSLIPRWRVHKVREMDKLLKKFDHLAKLVEKDSVKSYVSSVKFPQDFGDTEEPHPNVIQAEASDWRFLRSILWQYDVLAKKDDPRPLILSGSVDEDKGTDGKWILTWGSRKAFEKAWGGSPPKERKLKFGKEDWPPKEEQLPAPTDHRMFLNHESMGGRDRFHFIESSFCEMPGGLAYPNPPHSSSLPAVRVPRASQVRHHRYFQSKTWNKWRRRDVPLVLERTKEFVYRIVDRLALGDPYRLSWTTRLELLPEKSNTTTENPPAPAGPWIGEGIVKKVDPDRRGPWMQIELAPFQKEYQENLVFVRLTSPHSGKKKEKGELEAGLHLIPEQGTRVLLAWSGRFDESVAVLGNLRLEATKYPHPSVWLETDAVGERKKLSLTKIGLTSIDSDWEVSVGKETKLQSSKPLVIIGDGVQSEYTGGVIEVSKQKHSHTNYKDPARTPPKTKKASKEPPAKKEAPPPQAPEKLKRPEAKRLPNKDDLQKKLDPAQPQAKTNPPSKPAESDLGSFLKGLGKKAEDAATKAVDEAKKEAQKAVEQAKSGAKGLESKANKAIDSMGQEAKKMVDSLGSSVDSGVDGLNRDVVGGIGAARKALGNARDEVSKTVDSMVSKTESVVQDARSQAEGQYKDWRATAERRVAEGVAATRLMADKLGNKISNTMVDAQHQVDAAAGKVADAARDKVHDAAKMGHETLDGVGKQAEKGIDGLQGAAGNIHPEAGKAVGQGLRGGLDKGLKAGHSGIDGADQKATQSIDHAQQEVHKKGDEVRNTVDTQYKETQAKMDQKMTSTIDEGRKSLDEGERKVSQRLDEAQGQFAKGNREAAAKLNQGLDSVHRPLDQGLAGAQQVSEQTAAGLHQGVAHAEAGAKTAVDQTTAAAKGATQRAGQEVAHAGDQLHSGIEQSAGSAKGEIREAGQQFSKGADQLQSNVNQAGAAVKGTVKEAGQQVSSTVDKVGQHASSAAQKVGQQIPGAGEHVQKGIEQTTSAVKDATQKATQQVSDGIEKANTKARETIGGFGESLGTTPPDAAEQASVNSYIASQARTQRSVDEVLKKGSQSKKKMDWKEFT